MIDINNIINTALVAAVQQAVAPLVERIEKLESCNAEHHQRLLVLEGALTDRVVALENNPAQGVDTQAAPATTTDITRQIIDALSDTEHPLFQRLSQFMDAVAEQAMDDHCSNYDHDSYDNAVSDLEDRDFDDLVTRDDMRSEIEDVLNNATLSLSI